MSGVLNAWVDESIRRSGVAEPVYLLGATITSLAGYETTSNVLSAYAPKGNKLHWRDLGERGKRKVVQGLSTLDLEHIVIIRTLLSEMSEERARGLCIERLMWELDNRQIAHVTFESRSPTQDQTDLRRIDGLRSKQTLSSTIRAEWVSGHAEPLLWASDVLIGLVGDTRAGMTYISPEVRAMITEIVL